MSPDPESADYDPRLWYAPPDSQEKSMNVNPNCRLCFGRGWVLYPGYGGRSSPGACHYCELWSAESANATSNNPTPDATTIKGAE